MESSAASGTDPQNEWEAASAVTFGGTSPGTLPITSVTADAPPNHSGAEVPRTLPHGTLPPAGQTAAGAGDKPATDGILPPGQINTGTAPAGTPSGPSDQGALPVLTCNRTPRRGVIPPGNNPIFAGGLLPWEMDSSKWGGIERRELSKSITRILRHGDRNRYPGLHAESGWTMWRNIRDLAQGKYARVDEGILHTILGAEHKPRVAVHWAGDPGDVPNRILLLKAYQGHSNLPEMYDPMIFEPLSQDDRRTFRFLVHGTTQEGLDGIVQAGEIRPGSRLKRDGKVHIHLLPSPADFRMPQKLFVGSGLGVPPHRQGVPE